MTASWGAGLIARDGSVLDTGFVPAGPVAHGARDFIPLRNWCALEASSWLRLDTMQYADSPPDFIVDALPLHASVEAGRVSFVATVDPYPENEFFRFGVRTVARIPASPACQDPNRAYVAPTLSPRHEILKCWDPWQEGGAGPGHATLFVVDLHAHAVRRIRPPSSDVSGVSPRTPDAVAATVRTDGSVVATVWNACTSVAYVSEAAAAWKRIAVALLFGPPLEPAPICGRLTLRPGAMPANMGCGRAAGTLNPEDVTYVEQPDGTWLTLPYEVFASRRQDCAGDGGFAAFVRSGALAVTRFDRVGLRVIRPGFGNGPFAWLP
jgi:hypothetical protein